MIMPDSTQKRTSGRCCRMPDSRIFVEILFPMGMESFLPANQNLSFLFYSYRRLFTGLVLAVLTVWKINVKIAIATATHPANTKTIHPIFVL